MWPSSPPLPPYSKTTRRLIPKPLLPLFTHTLQPVLHHHPCVALNTRICPRFVSLQSERLGHLHALRHALSSGSKVAPPPHIVQHASLGGRRNDSSFFLFVYYCYRHSCGRVGACARGSADARARTEAVIPRGGAVIEMGETHARYIGLRRVARASV